MNHRIQVRSTVINERQGTSLEQRHDERLGYVTVHSLAGNV